MKVRGKEAKRALKNTIIATLIVAFVELACAIYLMAKWGLPFMEAIEDNWIFSLKGVGTAICGLIFYFFFVYFTEQNKED